MLAITVLGLLAMAFWALAFRTTLDLIRVERFCVHRLERDESVIRALAAGAALLRTGSPPSSPYSCIFTFVVADENRKLTATYTTAGGSDRWTIEVTESTSQDLLNLAGAPETFAQDEDIAPEPKASLAQ